MAALLAIGVASSAESVVTQESVDALERTLELTRHERLVQVKAAPAATLAPFATDGCSGGLSAGWEYLASMLPEFRSTHGDVPAWEACCVAHDRLYHEGGPRSATAEQSFVARKDADLSLLACVVETGAARAPQLMQEYDLSKDQVRQLYDAIAELMYRAVRIGGVPCSGLPWRWGYGWAPCD